jgi:hypothetical protein
MLADQAEKAMRQVREGVKDLLTGRYPDDKSTALADKLSRGVWTHDHPITFENAVELGLNVRADMPEAFVTRMSYHPQPVKRQPSVEYLPHPRRLERPAANR